jgi:hypothetical protein
MLSREDIIALSKELIAFQATMLTGLLRSVSVPSPAFDPREISYVVPRTYESVIHDYLSATVLAALDKILPDLERHIRADERRKIGEGLLRR